MGHLLEAELHLKVLFQFYSELLLRGLHVRLQLRDVILEELG